MRVAFNIFLTGVKITLINTWRREGCAELIKCTHTLHEDNTRFKRQLLTSNCFHGYCTLNLLSQSEIYTWHGWLGLYIFLSPGIKKCNQYWGISTGLLFV